MMMVQHQPKKQKTSQMKKMRTLLMQASKKYRRMKKSPERKEDRVRLTTRCSVITTRRREMTKKLWRKIRKLIKKKLKDHRHRKNIPILRLTSSK